MVIVQKIKLLIVFFVMPVSAFDEYLVKSIDQFPEQDYFATEGAPIYSCPKISEHCFLGVLETGMDLLDREFYVSVVPGKVSPRFRTEIEGVGLDRGDEILVLDYLGEGRSRVFFDGSFYSWKVPRTEDKCASEDSDRRYCWAEFILQPSENSWLLVSDERYKSYWLPYSYLSIKN